MHRYLWEKRFMPVISYRPREGYELHLELQNFTPMAYCYRPREGYVLH